MDWATLVRYTCIIPLSRLWGGTGSDMGLGEEGTCLDGLSVSRHGPLLPSETQTFTETT